MVWFYLMTMKVRKETRITTFNFSCYKKDGKM